MKIYQLIQILCQLEPKTEVFLSTDGFPYHVISPVEVVYNDKNMGIDDKFGSIVLTTRKDNYPKKESKKIK